MHAQRPVRAAVATLGCRVNFSESDRLRGILAAAGYHLVAFDQMADLYIVNTCTVTQAADRKSRQLLRRAARRRAGALVFALGCYADVAAETLRQIEGVDAVVRREEESQLLERIALALRSRGVEPPAAREECQGELLPTHPARALIKVQDGCDNQCAYCLVTIARGASRSRPANDILAEVRAVEQAGYREIILTGINLGAYRDSQEGNLVGLTRRILGSTSVERIRFSSIEPQDFPLGLLDLWPNPRLCRHLHLPLQSGSDRTLARMGRLYRMADFQQLVDQICQHIPGAVGLTTDIIVGFPGESDSEFDESMQRIADLPFSDLHIFPFSARPGTAAAAMPGAVPATVRRERGRRMHRLAQSKARGFRRSVIGQRLEVLWDGHHAGKWSGLSDNYLRVVTRTAGEWLGQITLTHVDILEGTVLRGTILLPRDPGDFLHQGPPRECRHIQTGQIAGFVV